MLKRLLVLRAWKPSPSRLYSTRGVLDDLHDRGLTFSVTRPDELNQAIQSGPRVLYSGIDPTAGSFHAGHLLPLMCMLHFQLHGHRVIPLIGGATGLIGDPSGRTTERDLAVKQEVEANVASLTEGVKRFFDSAKTYASKRVTLDLAKWQDVEVKNNIQWYEGVSFLDFLRNVGVHARVNTMINRESVQARMNSQQGISFTEFTYQLLQAYDFYHLHMYHGCSIQLGGSDQWGNILAGLDLIQKLEPDRVKGDGRDAFGITTPLLTTSSGDKFGKSAGNAVWLDPRKTPPFDFYQFFYNTSDADSARYLKFFTLLPEQAIKEAIVEHNRAPEQRIQQTLLAKEVTELVHGEAGVTSALRVTDLLYSADRKKLNATDILSAMKEDPRLRVISRSDLTETSVVKLAAVHRLTDSGSQAKTMCKARGLFVNDVVWTDLQGTLAADDLIDGRVAVLRAGKHKHVVLVARD
ncbi:hypothetical protein PLEOSDRAFT_1083989 [Pleurotus ostreatus PC15]|uniref:Tyrosine--tRNA ligase n=1 Tax=Pleurotus ostreatus (strain PC15) TaxID=1137138 RepID=A0A067NJN9_PLEO1|nr:hypothetical protein PLEOSDRAFT_1083989 [Pleurotus ostreatus PC15]